MSRPQQTVLLVEDNSTDALMIQRAFRKANLLNPIQIADDGDKAVDYLAGTPPFDNRDLHPIPMMVILDLKLPRRSGLEVLAWIREQPAIKRLPVVMLTSSRDNSDVNRAYDLGANSYLVKPVDFDQLLEMVRTLGLYWVVMNERPETHLS